MARARVPGKATRLRKDQLRQRLYWSRLRYEFAIGCTPCLIARNDPCLPQCSDLFGIRGKRKCRGSQVSERIKGKVWEK